MVQGAERAKPAPGQLHGHILGADGVESQDQRLVVRRPDDERPHRLPSRILGEVKPFAGPW
jgi:hypothetical protein